MALLVLEEAGCALAAFAFGTLADVDQRLDEEVKKHHRQDAPCIANEAGLLVLMPGADHYLLGLDCPCECVMRRAHRKLLVVPVIDFPVLAVDLGQP